MRITLVVLLAVIPAVAGAQPANRRPPPPDLGGEAQALADAGKFGEAAAKFREAYELEPRPDLLCNVGVAYYKADDLPRAQLYLAQCQAQSGSLAAEFATAVRNVLGVVDERLRAGDFAPVRVTVKPATAYFTISAFGAADRLIGSQLVWLPFGAHTIEVRAEGYGARSLVVEIAARGEIARTVELARTDVAGGALTTAPRPGPARSKKPALIATIATGVVGGAALAAYLSARGKASDAGKTDDVDRYDELVDAARSRQKLAWALGGLAAVGAGVSAYLWVRASRAPAPIEIAPTDGGAAVWFTGSF